MKVKMIYNIELNKQHIASLKQSLYSYGFYDELKKELINDIKPICLYEVKKILDKEKEIIQKIIDINKKNHDLIIINKDINIIKEKIKSIEITLFDKGG
jgi:hypothetical protein